MSVAVIRPLEAVEYAGARLIAHLADGRLLIDDHAERCYISFVPIGGAPRWGEPDARCRGAIEVFAGPREVVDITDRVAPQTGYRLMLDRFTAALFGNSEGDGSHAVVWTSNVLGDWVDLPDGTAEYVGEWVGDVRL